MYYNLWYNAPTMLPAGSLEVEEIFMSYRFSDSLREGTNAPAHKLSANLCDIYQFLRFQATCRQHLGCIIPQAVTHSLVLLKMGGINARNMLS